MMDEIITRDITSLTPDCKTRELLKKALTTVEEHTWYLGKSVGSEALKYTIVFIKVRASFVWFSIGIKEQAKEYFITPFSVVNIWEKINEGLSREKNKVREQVFTVTFEFITFHEFAHIYAGHQNFLNTFVNGKEDLSAIRIASEWEADDFAFQEMINRHSNRSIEEYFRIMYIAEASIEDVG